MTKKLTAAEVQAKIDARGRDITLIGEYVSSKTKTRFRCEEGHEWDANPGGIMQGHGCPHCAGRAPLTAEIVQSRIADRGLTMIGEYTNTSTKTRFRCAEGCEWDARPHSVMRGDGCPHCAGNTPLTKEIVQARLNADGRGITLIGEYINKGTKTRFRCAEGHEWGAEPNNVMQGKGCPQCAGNVPLTAEIVQSRINDRGITLIGEYLNNATKTLFRCMQGCEWVARPLDVMQGHGCPHCARRAPLTKEIVQTRLNADGRGITLIGAYVNTLIKTRFRCADGHDWDATPSSVMHGSGCPQCAAYGIWQHERAFVYVMDYDHRYTKIGITVDPSRRLRELILATSHAVELIALYDAGTGRDAYDMEQAIHRRLRAFSTGLSGFEGASELFHVTPATACKLIRKLGGIPAAAAAEAIIAE